MFHCVDIRGHSRSHSRRGSMDVLDEDLPVMKCFSAFQQSAISYRWWWSTQAKAYWRQRRKTMRLRYENREIIVHCSLKVEICGHNLQSAAPRFFFYFCGAMGGKPCFSAGMGSLFFLNPECSIISHVWDTTRQGHASFNSILRRFLESFALVSPGWGG